MKTSTDRILVSHTGTLPRPDDVIALHAGLPASRQALRDRLPSAVAEVVDAQVAVGIDIVNDGELPKHSGFGEYTHDRLGGFEHAPRASSGGPIRSGSMGPKDRAAFTEYWEAGGGVAYNAEARISLLRPESTTLVAPVTYIGAEVLAADIANVKAAADAHGVEAVLCSTHPHAAGGVRNEYYTDDQEMFVAFADALHEEYVTVTESGVILQIDNPQLAVRAQDFETVEEYKKLAEGRIELLNYALRGIPEDRVRMHVCFGANKGPHLNDIGLRDLTDLLFKVNVGCYNVEQSNPRHDHEWKIWEEVRLPDGKVLMPGLVTTATDIVEHPQLIAERIVRTARLIGRENLIAGTDCGISARVGDPKVCWAKLSALSEGAAIASRELWGG